MGRINCINKLIVKLIVDTVSSVIFCIFTIFTVRCLNFSDDTPLVFEQITPWFSQSKTFEALSARHDFTRSQQTVHICEAES